MRRYATPSTVFKLVLSPLPLNPPRSPDQRRPMRNQCPIQLPLQPNASAPPPAPLLHLPPFGPARSARLQRGGAGRPRGAAGERAGQVCPQGQQAPAHGGAREQPRRGLPLIAGRRPPGRCFGPACRALAPARPRPRGPRRARRADARGEAGLQGRAVVV